MHLLQLTLTDLVADAILCSLASGINSDCICNREPQLGVLIKHVCFCNRSLSNLDDFLFLGVATRLWPIGLSLLRSVHPNLYDISRVDCVL